MTCNQSTATLIIFAAALAAQVRNVAAESAGVPAATITTPYQQIKFIRETQAAISDKLATPITNLDQLKKEQQTFELAACAMATLRQQQQYLALAATAAKRRTKLQGEIETIQHTIETPLNLLTRRLGALTALMANQACGLAKTKASEINNDSGNKATGGTAATCTTYGNAKQENQDLCPQDSSTESKIKEPARRHAEITQVPLTSDDAFAFRNYKITIAWHSTTTSIKHPLSGNDIGCGTQSDSTTAQADLSGNNTHYVGIKAITRETEATKVTRHPVPTARPPSSSKQPNSGEQFPTTLVTATQTADIIQQLTNLVFQTTAPLQDDTIAELSNDADSQKAAWLVTAGKATTTQTPEALKKEVENLLGEKTKKVKELFLDTLSNTKLPNPPEDDQLKKSSPAIATSGGYTTALAFCRGMNEKQVQIKTITATDPPVSECKRTKKMTATGKSVN
ncbi:hypothetical protein DPX39_000078300 [Trypanosoma brucei equiperdum]|uniref:Variant surface glycoprotein n=1 Tax=Trypanosoma brucei equiperdum TaxID=630700 RepID=A0A3L6KQB1_9TRYP|nr:hypothetical protein DPX39_000104300 [Trypanosoma brucei equiperdum]RHW66811.1 hypothetical protein DPX39_000094800 [Trypanosoma brucei equiperdum]RHW66854.1 hypothetical protein DPX39_000101100 [Trypanosoma brucei equiperdum]RHW66855.1 hypothetical protein DPX39_000084500 [Trypanosoma brucei equiperdum]RHW66893.1 hypothetical protein DPX39_000087700 [Trypanosoma brucei equiperdum]